MTSSDFNTVDNKIMRDIVSDKKKFMERFVKPLAEYLYTETRKIVFPVNFSVVFKSEFSTIGNNEKDSWYGFAAAIPEKYKKVNLYIRPFEDFCRTCIITENEISLLAKKDDEASQFKKHDLYGIKDSLTFFTELNYLIPSGLKKTGFEVFHKEEISEINSSLIRKLARAIHSRYLHQMRNQSNSDVNFMFYNPGNQYISDFDDLPDEIKYSNTDNAAHIPTKLLSIGYKIRPVKKNYRSYALHLNEAEIETMARVEHLRWSWEKRLNGWRRGEKRNDILKQHPSLVPYDQLNEAEKEKDRELVKLIPSFLKDINFEAYPVSPGRFKKISYAIKPQSIIHKILNETSELNEQIRKLVPLPPEIEEMVRIRNNKIEEAINEVEGSYNYAQYIQEAFLPDDLFIRECFTDSFILFKPKDIVSGDFYFFSRQKDLIIFAAADCTGHGIPGALLSTIGYGILDQAVNEIKLTDPPLILHHLYTRIHRFLRKDTDESGLSDDMDIILCVLDTQTNALNFSGVRSRLYRVTDGKLTEYPANNIDENNNEDGEHTYTSATIGLNPSDTIYLSSDGYADQFGGKNHKRYKKDRFKKLLESIQDYTLPEQADRLYEETEQWREENNEDQTDDILVIGIRI